MQIPLEKIFVHSPEEFVIGEPQVWWEPPCYFQLAVNFSAKRDSVREELGGDFDLHHQIDAFSKQHAEQQLWAIISARLRSRQGQFDFEWITVFLKLNADLKGCLQTPGRFFVSPLRFQARRDFTPVDLRTILQQDPKTIDVYVVREERKLGPCWFLRMHSSLSSFKLRDQHLWFEKRIPWRLHDEDILPWFLATMRRLPKKAQPADLSSWQKRFLQYEDETSVRKVDVKMRWTERPKVILVFGAEQLIGYGGLFHLERQNIGCIQRHHEVVTVVGLTKYYELVEHWRFHLLTEDESAAQKIESELLAGERIHFGLDSQIVGMIAHKHKVGRVYAINVPEDRIHKLCLRQGQSLELVSPPSAKRKSYNIIEPLSDDAAP